MFGTIRCCKALHFVKSDWIKMRSNWMLWLIFDHIGHQFVPRFLSADFFVTFVGSAISKRIFITRRIGLFDWNLKLLLAPKIFNLGRKFCVRCGGTNFRSI